MGEKEPKSMAALALVCEILGRQSSSARMALLALSLRRQGGSAFVFGSHAQTAGRG
jgi:hypothetical protein